MELHALLAASQALGAQWSVEVRRDREPGALVAHRPEQLLRTASVAKVFVLLELADRLADGTIRADQLVERASTAPVRDSGLWYAMRADALPVVDLALLVGAVSDNWATNALLALCGLDRVQALAGRWAPGGSMLNDVVRDERTAGDAATLSVGCAHDWVHIVQRLQHRDGPDPAACDAVTGWLRHDTDLSMVAAAFGLDPLAHTGEDLGIRLWHKTGTDAGVRVDIGVVTSAATTVSYAALCNWPQQDTNPSTRQVILSTMRELGEWIRSLL